MLITVEKNYIATLEFKLSKLQWENTRLKGELGFNDAISTLTQERDYLAKLLTQERHHFSQQLSSLNESIVKKNHSIDELRTTYKAEKIQLKSLKDEITELNIRLTYLTKDNAKLSKEMADSLAENNRLKTIIDELKEENKNSENTINKLKIRTQRNSTNSSIPSSKNGFKKISNSRESTGKKPGGQVGHVGHSRKDYELTTEPCLKTMDNLSTDWINTGKYISKKVVSIECSSKVTEYRYIVYKSLLTNEEKHLPFEEGHRNEINYDGSVKAIAMLLNNYANVSIDKTSEFLDFLSDGTIKLSKGFINNLSTEFSKKSFNEVTDIAKRLAKSCTLHADFTTVPVDKKNKQLLLVTNRNDVLFLPRAHKGHKGIEGSPLIGFEGTIVGDHDKTFNSYGTKKQECLAHVLRYLKSSIENEPSLTWAKEMAEILKGAIHTRNQNKVSDEVIEEIERNFRRCTEKAMNEYCENPPTAYYKDGYNLAKRLHNEMENYLLFLHDSNVAPTNNIAEQNIRTIKRKINKLSTFRSYSSLEDYCSFLSLFTTEKNNKGNIYKLVESIFSK